jgi:hypothetical protein
MRPDDLFHRELEKRFPLLTSTQRDKVLHAFLPNFEFLESGGNGGCGTWIYPDDQERFLTGIIPLLEAEPVLVTIRTLLSKSDLKTLISLKDKDDECEHCILFNRLVTLLEDEFPSLDVQTSYLIRTFPYHFHYDSYLTFEEACLFISVMRGILLCYPFPKCLKCNLAQFRWKEQHWHRWHMKYEYANWCKNTIWFDCCFKCRLQMSKEITCLKQAHDQLKQLRKLLIAQREASQSHKVEFTQAETFHI